MVVVQGSRHRRRYITSSMKNACVVWGVVVVVVMGDIVWCDGM